MRKLLYPALCGILMSSCVSVDYLGKTYSPTGVPDEYFDERDIDRDYEVMGECITEVPSWYSMKKAQEKIRREASGNGADAILYISFDKRVTGQSVNHQGRENEDGRWSSSTTASNEEVKSIKAEFLKYR